MGEAISRADSVVAEKIQALNTLEKLRDCMSHLAPWIELPKDVLGRARKPIERMLEISGA